MQPLPDRLPLVIGVTGHRDLREEDVPRLEAEVARVIAGLRADYLDAETPIIVLSALAEGADRLVARVALKQGARLIAPLPMPPEEYRRDFEPGLKSGSAAEFDRLLAQASAAPVVPFAPGSSLDQVRHDPKKRAEQYRAVGLFIVQHSNIVVAVWDGDETNMATGGTAEVVKLAREGIPLEVSRSARASLDGSEIAPVVHVGAARQKGTAPAGAVGVERWGRAVVDHYRGGAFVRLCDQVGRFLVHLLGRERADIRARLSHAQRRELDAWERFGALIALTRQFNQEAASLAASERGRRRIAQSFDCLFDDPGRSAREKTDPKQADPKETDPERIDPKRIDPKPLALRHAPRWARLYSIADTLANDCHALFRRDWQLLFALTFAAFACFALFSYFEAGPFLIAYSVLYVLIFLVFWGARRRRRQDRFLDYRALAEALRVAVYWRLVGIGLRPGGMADAAGGGAGIDVTTASVLADAYPIKQPSELAWVKVCLRTLELLDRAEGAANERVLDPLCHDIARRCWVYGQYVFFRRRGFDHNQVAQTLDTWAAVLLVLTAFLLAPLLFLGVRDVGKTVRFGLDLHIVVLLAIGLLPGLAAALAGYSERLALNAQARQYDRMRELYSRAYELLPERIDGGTASLVRAVYRELGVEAMRESAEWVAVYRQRPIQPLP
jgi:hypothetical protein